MKKMQVTLSVQIELDCDPDYEENYQEKLDVLIQDLEEMDFKVELEEEIPLWEECQD